MTIAEVKGNAIIFSVLFIIVGAATILMARFPDINIYGRIFAVVIGTFFVISGIVFLRNIRKS